LSHCKSAGWALALSAMLLSGCHGSSPAAPEEAGAASLDASPPVAVETTESLESGGMTRTYILRKPAGYVGTAPLPLVIDLHPLTVTAELWSVATGWSTLADQEGFILVWPQGYMDSWNAGRCCDPAVGAKIDDVAFVRAVIAQVATLANVDPKRVYATGCSNGGGMTYRLACEAADVIAAVAPVDFDCVTGPTNSPSCADCNPSRPIAECQFRATGDMYVPYDGGPTSVAAGLIFPGAQANFADWAKRNGCTGSAHAETSHPACDTYASCGGGTETTLCTVDGGQHCGNYETFGIPSVAWQMFQTQKLP